MATSSNSTGNTVSLAPVSASHGVEGARNVPAHIFAFTYAPIGAIREDVVGASEAMSSIAYSDPGERTDTSPILYPTRVVSFTPSQMHIRDNVNPTNSGHTVSYVFTP